MSTMPMCRTPDEAFQAGWDAPCEHGVPVPDDCPRCRLTGAEIGRLAVLWEPVLRSLNDSNPPVPGRAAA
ncbi:hypothetical protein [Streptomyces synnematoformans]|uniref:Uncharacterized protein n=1 Tax=Streptomyces synnematoformans TaxID=415721 RepID=A0ABN2X959_9ACTN